MGKQLVRYENIVATMGEHIKRGIDEGRYIKVVIKPCNKYEKSIIVFRMYQKDDDSRFMKITKYQALKYLNDEQKATLKEYEKIMKVKKELEEMIFGRKIERLRQIEKERKNDSGLDRKWLIVEGLKRHEF